MSKEVYVVVGVREVAQPRRLMGGGFNYVVTCEVICELRKLEEALENQKIGVFEPSGKEGECRRRKVFRKSTLENFGYKTDDHPLSDALQEALAKACMSGEEIQ